MSAMGSTPSLYTSISSSGTYYKKERGRGEEERARGRERERERESEGGREGRREGGQYIMCYYWGPVCN